MAENFKPQLHTRLTEFLLLPALSCLFIYARLQSAKRSQSRGFLFSPFRELYRESLYMCILILVWPLFPHACCYWFACWMDLLVCTLPLVVHAHDLCSCSFCLLFLIINDIKSLRFAYLLNWP